MTDRVIEIQLIAPRPNLLSLSRSPNSQSFATARGTGPFRRGADGRAGRRAAAHPGNRRAATTRSRDTRSAPRRRRRQDAHCRFRRRQHRSGAWRDVRRPAGRTARNCPRTPSLRSGVRPVRARPGSAPAVRSTIPRSAGCSPRRSTGAICRRARRARPRGPRDLARAGPRRNPGAGPPAWFGTPLGDRLPALRATADRLFGKSEADHQSRTAGRAGRGHAARGAEA